MNVIMALQPPQAAPLAFSVYAQQVALGEIVRRARTEKRSIDDFYFRVGINTGGCSGFSYSADGHRAGPGEAAVSGDAEDLQRVVGRVHGEQLAAVGRECQRSGRSRLEEQIASGLCCGQLRSEEHQHQNQAAFRHGDLRALEADAGGAADFRFQEQAANCHPVGALCHVRTGCVEISAHTRRARPQAARGLLNSLDSAKLLREHARVGGGELTFPDYFQLFNFFLI